MRLDLRSVDTFTCEVILPNGDVLNLLPPSKGLADSFTNMGIAILSVGNPKVASEEREKNIEYLIECTSKCISRNKELRNYTAEEIKDIFSVNQVLQFLINYADFIKEIVQSKN